MWKKTVKVGSGKEGEGNFHSLTEVAHTKHLNDAPNINKFSLKNGVTLCTSKLNKFGSYDTPTTLGVQPGPPHLGLLV